MCVSALALQGCRFPGWLDVGLEICQYFFLPSVGTNSKW